VSTHEELHSPFGRDRFGQSAEHVARFFGSPGYILVQTLLVVVWIALNAAGIVYRWDPYPFILLNLAFSTQAAYAAPLILLAQTRQAQRDKVLAEADEQHRTAVTQHQAEMLAKNTRLTRRIEELTVEIQRRLGS
jgi:uncharacterized membrane protein